MNFFFLKWINQLDNEEEKALKRFAKSLSNNLKNFIVFTFKKYQKWKSNDKNQLSLDEIIKEIQANELGKYFTNSKSARHQLKSALIDFLVMNEAQYDDILKHKILFQSAKRRNFTDAYFYHLDQWEIALNTEEKKSNQSFDYWLNRFQINYNRFFHPEFNKFKLKSNNNNVNYIPEKVLVNTWENFQLFRLIMQTRLACEIEFQKGITGKNKVILDNLEQLNQSDIQLIYQYKSQSEPLNLYFNIYNWLCENDFKNIHNLEYLLNNTLKSIHLFSIEEQASILTLLYNCVARTIRRNKDSAILIKLYNLVKDVAKLGFNENLFGLEASIDVNLFLGIYDVISHVDKDFAKKMEEEYIHKLATKNDIFWVQTFIKTRHLATQNKHFEILQLLNQLEHHNNYIFTLRKFVLQLQATYDLSQAIEKSPKDYTYEAEDFASKEQWNLIEENIKKIFNSSEYLDKVSTEVYTAFFNFIEISTALFNNTNSIDEMKEMIKTKPIFGGDWLKEKIK